MRGVLIALCGAVMCAGFVCARPAPPAPTVPTAPPDYGHVFLTIGAAGNRAARASERAYSLEFAGYPDVGRVDYQYRIARTEITAAQWLPFLDACTRYWDSIGGSRSNTVFSSELIRASNWSPNAPPGWTINPGAENRAIFVSWHVAAYYCNWLHNGRPLGTWSNPVPPEVFMSGAYDVSTFTRNEDLTWNDQISRTPGAKYWIPSLNEWVKAAHYDPDRYGPGQAGYWMMAARRNRPLVSGMASAGGETSAGVDFPSGFDPRVIPVGSYPNVQSAWGLLDTSGGMREWTEAPSYDIPGGVPGALRSRIVKGSSFGPGDFGGDMLDDWGTGSLGGSRFGIRLASSVSEAGSPDVSGVERGGAAEGREER